MENHTRVMEVETECSALQKDLADRVGYMYMTDWFCENCQFQVRSFPPNRGGCNSIQLLTQ